VGRPIVALDSWELGEHIAVASSPQGVVEAAFAR